MNQGTMQAATQFPEGCADCRDAIRHCAKLLRQLQGRVITLDEFCSNTAVHLLPTCDPCMRSYLEALPIPTAARLSEYLQVTLASKGSRPFVMPHVVNRGSEEEILRKTQEVESRVLQLCQALSERCRSC